MQSQSVVKLNTTNQPSKPSHVGIFSKERICLSREQILSLKRGHCLEEIYRREANIYFVLWWMDDLQLYVLFNGISVISGWWMSDDESCEKWDPVDDWKDPNLQWVLNPGLLDQHAKLLDLAVLGLRHEMDLKLCRRKNLMMVHKIKCSDIAFCQIQHI